MEVDKAFSLYFQHLLEALVEEVYKIMQSEFIYKKGGLGKLATLRDRLADPVHGSAIKTFELIDELKSRLPTEFWVMRNLRDGVKRPKILCVIYHMQVILSIIHI